LEIELIHIILKMSEQLLIFI